MGRGQNGYRESSFKVPLAFSMIQYFHHICYNRAVKLTGCVPFSQYGSPSSMWKRLLPKGFPHAAHTKQVVCHVCRNACITSWWAEHDDGHSAPEGKYWAWPIGWLNIWERCPSNPFLTVQTVLNTEFLFQAIALNTPNLFHNMNMLFSMLKLWVFRFRDCPLTPMILVLQRAQVGAKNSP